MPVDVDGAPAAEYHPPVGAGELAAEYHFAGELGRGGAAVVHLARNRETRREVAIKLIRSPLATDPDTLNRFSREARTAALLQHPNIVSVHDVRRLRHGGLALIMECVRGGTLKQRIQQHAPLGVDEVTRTVQQIARALQCAHRHGIVHRDVKPENIFLEEVSGCALLADFGIARTTESGSGLTLDGFSLGTPAYMAPEQIDGVTVDGRADLYSLALVAWEMLTGDAPWEGETLYGVIYNQKHRRLPSVADFRSDVPQALLDVISRASEKEPGDRFPDADALLRVLDAAPPPRGWRNRLATVLRRPRRRLAAGDHAESGAVDVERLVEQVSNTLPPPVHPTLTVRFRREEPSGVTLTEHGDLADGGDDQLAANVRSNASAPLGGADHDQPLPPPEPWRGTTAHSPPLGQKRPGPDRDATVPAMGGRADLDDGDALEDSTPVRCRETMPAATEHLHPYSDSGTLARPDPRGDRHHPDASGAQPAWQRRGALLTSSLMLFAVVCGTWAAVEVLRAGTGPKESDAAAAGLVARERVEARAPGTAVISPANPWRSTSSPRSEEDLSHLCTRDARGTVRCGPGGETSAASGFGVDASALLDLRCRVPDGGVALCTIDDHVAQRPADPRRRQSTALAGIPCTLLNATDGGCWRNAGHAVLPGGGDSMAAITVWEPWVPRDGGAEMPQVRHEADVASGSTASDEAS